MLVCVCVCVACSSNLNETWELLKTKRYIAVWKAGPHRPSLPAEQGMWVIFYLDSHCWFVTGKHICDVVRRPM